GLISAGAAPEEKTGPFHGAMGKEANKYISVQCPKNYPTVLADKPPKTKDAKGAGAAGAAQPIDTQETAKPFARGMCAIHHQPDTLERFAQAMGLRARDVIRTLNAALTNYLDSRRWV